MSGMLFAPHFQENMTEVELECAVYGEGTVFSVKIARDAKVGALQEAITAVLSTEQHAIPPRLLTLYLARKNGEWLKDDRHVKSFLRAGISTEYEEMRPSWKLKKEELLGPNFEPGEEEIHVLVELPESAVSGASENSAMAQMAKEVREMYEQIVQTKRKRYTHSTMSSDKGNALLQELNILVEPVDWVPFAAGVSTRIEAFNWESIINVDGQEIKLTEEQQRERYRAYVEANIGNVLMNQQLCVLGVEDKNILNAKVPGHDIELAGRTDILVLSALVKKNPRDLQYLPGVRMLIEVKKEVQVSSESQALSELIALDLRSGDPVMALLTDLNHDWVFFWVSENKNKLAVIQKTTIKEPGEAFEVIKTLLAQSPTGDADISLPFIGERVKRRKLAEVLPAVGEGGESGGIREAIERYYDIASVLGPDIEMARVVGRQVVQSIPAFSMYT